MKIENRKNRNSFDIIANILEISKNGAKKTRIMYLANLSFDMLKKYLNFLINKNLLKYNSIKGKYKTTNRGLRFLKEYYEFKIIENKHREKLRVIQKVIGS